MDCVDYSRLLCRSTFYRCLLSRRELLQIRLSNRSVPFCHLIDLAAGSESARANRVFIMQDARLSAWQRTPPRLRDATLSAQESREYGLHILSRLRPRLST